MFGKTSFARRYVPVNDVVFSRNFQWKKPQKQLQSVYILVQWWNFHLKRYTPEFLNGWFTYKSPNWNPENHLNQTPSYEFHVSPPGSNQTSRSTMRDFLALGSVVRSHHKLKYRHVQFMTYFLSYYIQIHKLRNKMFSCCMFIFFLFSCRKGMEAPLQIGDVFKKWI